MNNENNINIFIPIYQIGIISTDIFLTTVIVVANNI